MKDPKDNWLKREIEREKKISAWDLDEPNKVRINHEENCPREKLAVEHIKIHEGNIYSDEEKINTVRPSINYRSTQTQKALVLIPFFITILFMIIFFINLFL